MRNNKLLIGALVVVALGLAGCAGKQKMRADFGNSTQINREAQVINADAASQAPAATAVDGQKAEKGLQRYRADKGTDSRSTLLDNVNSNN